MCTEAYADIVGACQEDAFRPEDHEPRRLVKQHDHGSQDPGAHRQVQQQDGRERRDEERGGIPQGRK